PPTPGEQPFQITLTTLGRLTQPEQFAEIVIRSTPDGRVVRIRDVGWVELWARSQDIIARLDGHPTTSVAVFQLPDANALDTADRIRAKMDDLKQSFPPGVDYAIAYDTTPFVRESIQEVFKTLGDAVALVALVV